MVSDPEVEGEFTLRQKCEEFMQQIVDTNKLRMEDKEWLVNMANNDTEGDKVCQDNEVIFAARKYLQEHNIDWHTGEDVAVTVEPEAKAETVEIVHAAEKPIVVYSLGQYGVGERGEELRTLAHQVKEGGSNDAITEAVNQLSDLFGKIPEAERERMVLVPMPGKTGIPGYTDDIAYDLGDYMEIDSNSSLISSPHPSLYDLKKENGNENLPKIDFTFNDELSEGTIVVLVDNVLDTGHTLSQAAQANFGKDVEVRAVVLAHTDNYLQYHPELAVKMPLAQEIEKKPVVSQPVRIAAQVVKQEQKVEMPSLGLRDALIERMRGAGIVVNLDAADSAYGASMLEQIADKLDDGMVALVALADEAAEEELDAKLSGFDVVIARFDADKVADEVDRAYEKQAEMARLARMELRKETKDQVRADIQESVKQGQENFRYDMAVTKGTIKELKAERKARIQEKREKRIEELEENSEILKQNFTK